MTEKLSPTIDSKIQPNFENIAFDLETTLNGVVTLKASTSEQAFTASVLGTERQGYGVHIADSGLILTIGYLVAEAEQIWITTNSGQVIEGHSLAYDYETGFGLIQCLGELDAPTIPLGNSNLIKENDNVIIAGAGGKATAITAKIAARAEFAGYWEYVIENAIFSAPSHPNWGGAALLNNTGEVCGIGSLFVNKIESDALQREGNMIVPVELLDGRLQELQLYGQTLSSPRPWLGIFASQIDHDFEIVGLYNNGPAALGGLETGDVILEINNIKSNSLANFFRNIWSIGPAGCEVPMKIMRNGSISEGTIISVDRRDLWKKPQFH